MVSPPKYQIIAAISGILTIAAFSHVFNRVRTTKQTEHITYIWILLVLSAQILLAIYGIINGAYGIYLPAIIIINEVLYILYVKMNNETADKIEDKIEDELRRKKII